MAIIMAYHKEMFQFHYKFSTTDSKSGKVLITTINYFDSSLRKHCIFAKELMLIIISYK